MTVYWHLLRAGHPVLAFRWIATDAWYRLRAAVDARLIPWQIRREARHQADGRAFWGDTGTVGDLSADDGLSCSITEADYYNSLPRPLLEPIPDDGFRPVAGAPLHSHRTWVPDAWTTTDVPAPANRSAEAAGTQPGAVEQSGSALPPPAPSVPGSAADVTTVRASHAGGDSLPGTGGDGRTDTQRPQGADRPLAGDETSLDMDGWLIELLTCSPERIAAAARQSLDRYERHTRRNVAAYLTALAEVAR